MDYWDLINLTLITNIIIYFMCLKFRPSSVRIIRNPSSFHSWSFLDFDISQIKSIPLFLFPNLESVQSGRWVIVYVLSRLILGQSSYNLIEGILKGFV